MRKYALLLICVLAVPLLGGCATKTLADFYPSMVPEGADNPEVDMQTHLHATIQKPYGQDAVETTQVDIKRDSDLVAFGQLVGPITGGIKDVGIGLHNLGVTTKRYDYNSHITLGGGINSHVTGGVHHGGNVNFTGGVDHGGNVNHWGSHDHGGNVNHWGSHDHGGNVNHWGSHDHGGNVDHWVHGGH